MRLAKFILLIGITIVVLSYTGPSYESTFSTFSGVDPGFYGGCLFQCTSEVHVRISSWLNEVFSAFFVDYNNCIRALEDVSLENVTAMRTYSNLSQIDEWIAVPGWYAVIVKPENNQTIESVEYDIRKPVPNQGLLLLGASTIVVSVILILPMLRDRLVKVTSS